MRNCLSFMTKKIPFSILIHHIFKQKSIIGILSVKKDHLRLKEVLVSLKGKFLLTYNDCPFIRTLYQQFSIVPMVRQNNMASCSTMGDYLEIMIKNINSV